MIEAVIFDMDGLMINSEPAHFKAFQTVFKQYSKSLNATTFQRYIGQSDLDQATDMVVRFDLPIDATELATKKQHAYQQLLQTIEAREGLFELLSQLKAIKLATAIASSSLLNEIETVVAALRIQKSIDHLTSATEVEHGKPAPDILLLTSQKLGVRPEACLVLDDAPSGVQAAVAAKMPVFAIPSDETAGLDFSDATKRLSSLREVFEAMQSL